MKKLLVIVGPTASGKTALAETLAQTGAYSLLSADSQQVYRGMDIGTAKPLGNARQAWGLLDLVDPGQPFSAGAYCRFAVTAIEQAWREGKTPCLVGGTGLYLRALLQGLAELPPIPMDIRENLTAELEDQGLGPLVERLQAQDPELVRQIDLQNPRRVLRGLEVFKATGKPLSHWQNTTTTPALVPEQCLWFGLDPGKDILEKAIGERTQKLLALGWLTEVEALARVHGDQTILTTAAIGYPELLRHLRGQGTLLEASQAIEIQTRQYARRQRTWFKAQSGIQWLEPGQIPLLPD